MKIDSKNLLIVATTVLVIGAILTFLSPFIFTRDAWLGLSFEGTGQIGDTIGGLTAPIINITSAVLVFLALAAQVEANRLIQDQIKDQNEDEVRRKNYANFFEIYKQVRDDLDNTEYTSIMGATYKGTGGIGLLMHDMEQRYCRSLEDEEDFDMNSFAPFIKLLMVLESLTQKMISSELSGVDLETLRTLINYLIDSRINTNWNSFETCSKCNKIHSVYPTKFTLTLSNINQNLGMTKDLVKGHIDNS